MNTEFRGPFVTPRQDFLHRPIGMEKEPLQFGVSYLDAATEGIRQDDLVLLSGKSGSGKTEMAVHIALHNAKAGKKVMYAALEAYDGEIGHRLTYKLAAKKFYNERRNGEKPWYRKWILGKQPFMKEITDDVRENELPKYESLFIRYRNGHFGLESITQLMVTAQAQGTDLIVMDHLHYFDLPGENENKEYKEILKVISDQVKQTRIPMILVVHVRKQWQGEKRCLPSRESIMGSSDIYKIATTSIMIGAAKDEEPGAKTGIYATYIDVNKYRIDSSVEWFTGKVFFDISTNEYRTHYDVGTIGLDGAWKESTEYPKWAKRHQPEVYPKLHQRAFGVE